MKKIIFSLFAFISFVALADKSNINIQTVADKDSNRVYQNYRLNNKESINVVFLIKANHVKKEPHSIEMIISTSEGSLIIGKNSTKLVGNFNLKGVDVKKMSDELKEELFFSHPIFDQLISENIGNQINFESHLKGYSASECQDLASAISQLFAQYMYLRRTSSDTVTIGYVHSILSGMVMEYNENC